MGLIAVAALLASASAPKATAGAKAGHNCLVMTGSGDQAFVRNFNPYTATSLPSGGFVRGAFYEPLIISTVAGGGHQYPWLAKSWKWSNGNKTLTLNLQRGVKWSDGKPLTSKDVVYSLTAGQQDKTMDMIGLTSPATNVASIKAKGPYAVAITLKTVGLAVHPGSAEWAVRRPAAHLVEGLRPGDLHEHQSGWIRSVQQGRRASRPRTTFSPRTRSTGSRVRRGSSASSTRRRRRTTQRSCRSRAARSTGRTTSCRTSSRPTSPRTRSTTTRSMRRRRIRSRSSSTRRSTRTAFPRSARR